MLTMSVSQEKIESVFFEIFCFYLLAGSRFSRLATAYFTSLPLTDLNGTA